MLAIVDKLTSKVHNYVHPLVGKVAAAGQCTVGRTSLSPSASVAEMVVRIIERSRV
jgi:hypothetical protein